jgi:hypothetical protein
VIKIRSIARILLLVQQKKRNPLEINRIPQVIVNTIKTAKKKKKKYRLTNLKSIRTKKIKICCCLFPKNHSQINQTNSIATTVYRKIKYWKITLKICLSAK